MFITSPYARRAATEAFGTVASGRIASTARVLIGSAAASLFTLDARRACVLRPSARPIAVVSDWSPSARIVPRTCTASSIGLPALGEPRLRAQHRAVAHQRQRAVALGLRRAQRRRQRVVVVQRALGELADDVEPADGRELEIEVVEQVDDELLRLAARGLGHQPRLLGLRFRLLRALHAEPAEDRAGDGDHGQHAARRRDLARPHQRLSRRPLARALRFQLPLGLVARVALEPQVAAGLHHAAEHVVGELDAADVEALLDAQQAPVDQLRQRAGRRARRGEELGEALLGEVLAVARLGEEMVLDHLPHARRLAGERALVELGQDGVARARPGGRRRSRRGPARCARC